MCTCSAEYEVKHILAFKYVSAVTRISGLVMRRLYKLTSASHTPSGMWY